jgi:biotin carboxyl carrier protein
VLRINVEVGERVEPGQPVVALSAMKMELVCEAPAAGVVDAILCRVDQIVAADDVLAMISVEDS